MVTKVRVLAMSCMVYLIWLTRNSFNFEGGVPNLYQMLIKIQTHVFRCMVS